MRAYIAAAVTAMFMTSAAVGQERLGMLEPLTVAQFLKLPDDFQTLYVAGALGGMAFMGYTYAESQYPAWIKCVRSQTLGKTNEDVVAFLKADPKFEESVVSALAQTIGRRCKH